MRVRKDETTIHWHDFIAAGLSQCAVDDRNLRLAFGRLDQKGKGYISFENVLDLLGADTFGNEDQMLQMWGGEKSMISYDDFVYPTCHIYRRGKGKIVDMTCKP